MPTAPKNASEVIPRLWQGGAPKPGSYAFDLIVLAASEYQPSADKFPGVEILRVPLPDDWRGMTADARAQLYASAVAAAQAVATAHRAGRRVLVTCGAGLNRSGLITGLALRDLGHTADEALALIRKARGARALAGKAFPDFIRAYQPGTTAALSPEMAAAAAATAAAAAAAAGFPLPIPMPTPGTPPPSPPSSSKLWRVVAVGAVVAGAAAILLVSEARS